MLRAALLAIRVVLFVWAAHRCLPSAGTHCCSQHRWLRWLAVTMAGDLKTATTTDRTTKPQKK
jgi:hypothetical protein